MKHGSLVGVVAGCVCLVWGCGRAPEPHYVLSEGTEKLPQPIQQQIRDVLESQCGTYRAPKPFGEERAAADSLKLGQTVYMQRCQQCHGTSGDGNGPVARFMSPKPRDYRRGIFKFTTTPYGIKPQRQDLVRTVLRGIPGTSMPSFHLLHKKEIEAVVDYVLNLTHRGEIEDALDIEATNEEQLDPEVVPELISSMVTDRWKQGSSEEVHPLTPQPELTRERVIAGKAAFLSKGCSKCHGEDGRGQTRENIGVDSWGHPTKAADLTSGMLRGGNRPIDVYRRIISGINGTPMPGFRAALADEPDTIWDLVSYVIYVSNERRRGKIPAASLLQAASPAAVPETTPAPSE